MFDLRKRIGVVLGSLMLLAAGCGEIPAAGDGGPGDDGGNVGQACGSKTCSPNGMCVEPTQSLCECKPGFTGNGETCADVDECDDPTSCGANATCKNEIGSFTCECQTGFVPAPSDEPGCVPRWALVWEDDFVLGSYGHAAAAGRSIFYAQDGFNLTGVFRSIDVNSGQVSPESPMPPTSNDFCNCGYGGWLNATADGALVYVGNYAQLYNPLTKVWLPFDYPSEMRGGEAGQALVGTRLVVIGGRDNPKLLRRLDVSTGKWQILGTLPAESERSAAVGVGNDVFVYGGQLNGQATGALVRFTVNPDDTFSTETLMPTIPNGQPQLVVRDGKLLADVGGELAVYDIANKTWASERIPLPPGFGTVIPIVIGKELWIVAGGQELQKTRFFRYYQ
jgi:hypothetical protein